MESSSPRYSAFWPLVIVLVGLALWSFFQLDQLLVQKSALRKEYLAMEPAVVPAQNAESRLISLMNDLTTTGKKDPAAAQIVKEASDAGLRLNANADSSSR